MSAADGSVGATTKIVDNGPDSRRWNLVIMGDGYQEAELGQFATDAQHFVDQLFSTPPYKGLQRAINVYRVDVTSVDSGTDVPRAMPPVTAQTYLDSTFPTPESTDPDRLLFLPDEATARALSVANTAVPANHARMVIVNSAAYGGSGGPVGVMSTAPDSAQIGIHELGHSAFGLADEYQYMLGCGNEADRDNHPNVEPSEPNVTVNDDPATIKWASQVFNTPMPRLGNSDCSTCNADANPYAAGAVGAFAGAHYYHCGAYRPSYDCMMRTLGQPLCAVCASHINGSLYPHMSRPHEVHREAWHPGWTSVVTLELAGVSHVLTYNGDTGEATINVARANGTGIDNVLSETWDTGFTTIMPFAMGGHGWFVAYKAGDGTVQITQVADDGSSVTPTSTATWSTDFSTLMPFQAAAGPALLAYSAASGNVRMATLRGDGSGVDVHYSPPAGWSGGWTSFVAFELDGQPHYLAYKSATGQVSIDRITPGADGYDDVWSAAWGADWQLFPSFQLDGEPHFIAYKPALGDAAMDVVHADGSGVDVRYNAMWRPDWTVMTPFVGTTGAYQLAYSSTSGTMAIDQID
jgi:hypothetical protein